MSVVKYRTIVADPPWPVKDFGARSLSTAGFWREDHTGFKSKVPYSIMTIEEIAGLPVSDLAEDGAHLYLWAVNQFIEDAYTVARAWQFRPVSLLTWCKSPRGLGPGGAFANTTEFILFCRRGDLATTSRLDTTWFQWKRPYIDGKPAHSLKPDGLQDAVEQVSPGPYLELFARRQRLGWDTWGNEALEHVTMGETA